MKIADMSFDSSFTLPFYKEDMKMKRIGCGIAVLLFAILFQLGSTGLEIFSLGMGLAGLIIVFSSTIKTK